MRFLRAVCAIFTSFGLAFNAHAATGDRDGVYWDDPAIEAAIAASAAPNHVSDNATIWVLSEEEKKFVVFKEGTNGYNCGVMRRWGSPYGSVPFESDIVQTPNCFDAYASKTHMQEMFLRHELGLAGKSSDEIKNAVFHAYGEGKIPTPIQTSFGYMMSEKQCLTPQLIPLIGNCRGEAHIMVYHPNNTNQQFGGSQPGTGLPFVLEQPGTFMAVTVIPVPRHEKVDYNKFR